VSTQGPGKVLFQLVRSDVTGLSGSGVCRCWAMLVAAGEAQDADGEVGVGRP